MKVQVNSVSKNFTCAFYYVVEAKLDSCFGKKVDMEIILYLFSRAYRKHLQFWRIGITVKEKTLNKI